MTQATRGATATAAPPTRHQPAVGRRWVEHPQAAPLAAAGAVLSAWAVVGVVDPATSPLGLPCPLHAVTGLWCPLCGGTRAAHALANADLTAAASANVVVVIAAPVAAFLWLRWVVRRRHDRNARLITVSSRTTALAVAALALFALLRNLPWGAPLAP